MRTREDKIKIIKAIQSGMPINLALKYAGKPVIAIQELDGSIFIDDKLVSEKEVKRIEKIPGINLILVVNKTGKELDSHGFPV